MHERPELALPRSLTSLPRTGLRSRPPRACSGLSARPDASVTLVG